MPPILDSRSRVAVGNRHRYARAATVGSRPSVWLRGEERVWHRSLELRGSDQPWGSSRGAAALEKKNLEEQEEQDAVQSKASAAAGGDKSSSET